MQAVSRVEFVKTKYTGRMAQNYDAQRVGTEKWREENRVIRQLLEPWPAGTRVLDVPVGTGRNLPFFVRHGFRVVGLDISEDMLSQARNAVTAMLGHVRIGDIFHTGLDDKYADLTLSIRFMNQVGPEDMQKALIELQRVTRKQIIFNLRIWTPGTKYRRANPMSAVEACLQPGWKITDSVRIHQDDFRMIVLTWG